MSTFGSLGILLLQVMVSFAVIAFFWRDGRRLNVWRRMIAPGLSAAGLSVCIVLMATNLDLMSGSRSLIVQSFPALLLLIGLAGAGLGARTRARRAEANFRIGSQ